MNNKEKSQIMFLSWDIQRGYGWTRSKSLLSAWIIKKTQAISLHYLAPKRVPKRKPAASAPGTLALFNL